MFSQQCRLFDSSNIVTELGLNARKNAINRSFFEHLITVKTRLLAAGFYVGSTFGRETRFFRQLLKEIHSYPILVNVPLLRAVLLAVPCKGFKRHTFPISIIRTTL